MRFVDLYSPLLYAWCVAGGLADDEAGDVAEQVFRQVLRQIDDFRQDPAAGSFQRWVKALAESEILERRSASGAATVSLDKERAAATSEEEDAGLLFREALRQLGEQALDEVRARIYRATPTLEPGPEPPNTVPGEVGDYLEGGISYNFRFVGANVVPRAEAKHSPKYSVRNYLVVWLKFAGQPDWTPAPSFNFYGTASNQTACETADTV